MHRVACARHMAAENTPDALVSETYAENWGAACKFADYGGRYPSLTRGARAGGDDHRARLDCHKIREAERVVADYFRCFAKLSEIASNVEDERIIVVDDDNQDAPELSA